MTAFSTRCCRRRSWLALLSPRCGSLLARAGAVARAPRASRSRRGAGRRRGRLLPRSDFRDRAQPALEDALNKGVPLHFLLEFELIRPRWYWLNEKVVNVQQRYRLSYNALTRQYRVGVGTLYQNFPRSPKRSSS